MRFNVCYSPPPEQTLILKNCGSEASTTYCEWSQSPASHLAQAKAGLLQKLGVAIEGSRELFLPSSGQKHWILLARHPRNLPTQGPLFLRFNVCSGGGRVAALITPCTPSIDQHPLSNYLLPP